MTVRTAPGSSPTWPPCRAGRSASISMCRSARRAAATATSTPIRPTELGGANPDGLAGGPARRARPGGVAAGRRHRRSTRCSWGAGRPRCWAATGLQAVLDAVRAHFTLVADAEVTTEANPESTSPQLVRAIADGGVHAGVARHAVRGPARAGGAGPGALAGPGARRGARSPRRRFRARQPRPHLWHAGGVRRRPAPLRGRGDRRRRRPCVRLRAGGRGRDGVGAPGAARRDRGPRQRRARATLRVARRAAVGGRLRLVRGLQLEQARRRMPAQHRVLERRRMVGRRTGSAWLRRRDSVVECQAPQRLCAIVGGRAAAGGRFRAARCRRPCTSRT